MQPASAIDANMCVAVSQSTRLCSISTVSQAKPARAMKRAAVMLPSDSQVPTDGRPALSACLTGLARMLSLSEAVRPGHEDQPGAKHFRFTVSPHTPCYQTESL